jgi:uncharacterized membrane protein/nitrite reductase/ring-hydroxylating ferredoxin subunit
MPSLKDILEGKPLRSPLHPALVHLPVALFPISLLLDAASWAFSSGELHLVRSAFITLTAGLVTAVFASIFGIVDYTEIRSDHPAKRTATLHMMLNLVAMGLFSLGAGLRYDNLDTASTALAPLALSAVALGILAYSGYLGGHLVYSDGVGVGRHRRDTPLPERTLHVQPGTSSSASVAGTSTLHEGETLRVEIDGIVLAVARTGGQLCAFQEFCTHRFGPLSEGKLEAGQVVCPWHGSRFDTRTGKVTQGPAKVDLRIARTEMRDGKIWLEPPSPL